MKVGILLIEKPSYVRKTRWRLQGHFINVLTCDIKYSNNSPEWPRAVFGLFE